MKFAGARRLDLGTERNGDTPDWVDKARKGDSEAFVHLYKQHNGWIRALVYRLCPRLPVDDCVQEVFVKAWIHMKTLRDGAVFHSWLKRIAVNTALDLVRTAEFKSQQNRLSEQDLDEQGQGHLLSSQADSDLRMANQQLVTRALAQLEDAHRSVIVLHELEDMSVEEVAECLRIPVGTVKSRLHNARKKLREYLKPHFNLSV